MTRKYDFLQSERGSKLCIFLIDMDDFLGCRISEEDFPTLLNFYDFKHNSRRIAGEDLSNRVRVPEISNREVDLILRGYHDMLARERDSKPYWKGRNAIISLLNAARLILLKKGTFVASKREITEKFGEMLPETRELLERAVQSRENWEKIKDDDSFLERRYEEALSFLRRYTRDGNKCYCL